MSYNPYAGSAGDNESTQNNRLHQPQPTRPTFINQAQQQQQQQQAQAQQQIHGGYQGFIPQQGSQAQPGFQQNGTFLGNGGAPYQQFFSDPKTQIGLQVGQNAMLAGSHFVEQNFQKYVPTGDIRFYFKVSNSYVLSKLFLILFPFRNKNWNRSYRANDGSAGAEGSTEAYAYPLEDLNAPDLYIPLMGIVTYILTLALLAGLKGEFHPEVFGFESSSTLAYLLLDITILKMGLYFLSVSSKIWDLVSYIGYKFVPIIIILFLKTISSVTVLNWVSYIYLIVSFGYFTLRALRFNLYGGINNSAQNLNSKSLKNSNYFLLIYSFVFQGALLWLLS